MKIARTDHRLARVENNGKWVTMRSTLEARWATFFWHLGLPWEYEPGTFTLTGGGKYTPDFFVAGLGWVEIKPSVEHIRESWPRLKRFIAEYCKQQEGDKAKVTALCGGNPIWLTDKTMVLFEDGKIYAPNQQQIVAIFARARRSLQAKDSQFPESTYVAMVNKSVQAANEAKIDHTIALGDILRLDLDRALPLGRDRSAA